LGNDVATFGSDHDTLAKLTAIGIVNSFKHTPWNTSRSFDTRLIVKFTVTVGWAVLYPVALNVYVSTNVLEVDVHANLSVHIDNKHNWVAKDDQIDDAVPDDHHEASPHHEG
jgi:hypothetical protein